MASRPPSREPPPDVSVCRLCTLVQRVPEDVDPGDVVCCRCGSSLLAYRPRDLMLTRCLLIAAVILFPPANLLPIAVVEHMADHREFTIVDGILHVFSLGMYGLGLLVSFTSFFTPMLKIVGLCWLAFAPPRRQGLKNRRRVLDLIRRVNAWNAMEMCLLSSLLAMADFPVIASVSAGWGAAAFTAVVVLTTAASITLDPAALRLGWARPARTAPSGPDRNRSAGTGPETS